MPTIQLANVTSKDSPTIERLNRILHGKTYMNFNIVVCPAGGSFDVLAETNYDASEEEVRDFLLFVLASAA